MKVVFTLTSAESKRLIAKAVAALPAVQKAWQEAYVVIAGGTTNGFVLQELTGDRTFDPAFCTIGTITNGCMCLTNAHKRSKGLPAVFFQGERSVLSMRDALMEQNPHSVVIKGANGVDPQGNVGILTSSVNGGSFMQFYGLAVAQGLPMIVPVGLEKLIPSVPQAARAMAQGGMADLTYGAPVQLFCVSAAQVVTEIESLKTLFGLDAALVASGGVGGSEGAVTLCAWGEEEKVERFLRILEREIKGEPPLQENGGACETCARDSCRYHS